jgi:hypothetical protein
MAEYLFGSIPIKTFGGRIPTDDSPIEVLANYRVVGRFDDSGQMSLRVTIVLAVGRG